MTSNTVPLLYDTFLQVVEHPHNHQEVIEYPGVEADYNQNKFTTQQGEIELYWSRSRPQYLKIFSIEIRPELQRQGIFSDLLRQICDSGHVTILMIVAAESEAITTFLDKFMHNGLRFTGDRYANYRLVVRPD